LRFSDLFWDFEGGSSCGPNFFWPVTSAQDDHPGKALHLPLGVNFKASFETCIFANRTRRKAKTDAQRVGAVFFAEMGGRCCCFLYRHRNRTNAPNPSPWRREHDSWRQALFLRLKRAGREPPTAHCSPQPRSPFPRNTLPETDSGGAPGAEDMRYIIPSSAALTAPTFTGFVDATRARRVGVAAAMGGVSAFSLRARSSRCTCKRVVRGKNSLRNTFFFEH